MEVVTQAALVLAIWSAASVIVSVPVAAVFRMQARWDRLWEEAERRRAWLEAMAFREAP